MLANSSSAKVDELYDNHQSTSSYSAINNGLINESEIDENAPKKAVLKRNLGLFSGTSFIMGVIIGKSVQYWILRVIFHLGTGIFVSPKGVLLYSESIGLCLIIWVASGLIALVGKLNNNLFLVFLRVSIVMSEDRIKSFYLLLFRSFMLCRDRCSYTIEWFRTLLLSRR